MASEIPPNILKYQKDHIHESRAPGLIAFFVIMLTAALASVGLRLASRKCKGLAYGADDYVIVLAAIFLIGVFVMNFMYISAGLSKHMLALTKEQTALMVKLGFPANILYTITWPTIKISILCLYRRIFFVVSGFRRFTEAFIGVLMAFILSTILVDIFSCHPVQKAWKPLTEGHCINSTLLFKTTAGINVAFDVIILLSPLPLVWKLKSSLRLKIGLTFVFVLGGITCITSLMRIITFNQISKYDPTWTYVASDYWTAAELCLSVICACLPTIRPLWRTIIEAYRRSRSHATSQSDNPPMSQQGRAKSYHMSNKGSSSSPTAPEPSYQPQSPSRSSRLMSPKRRGFERLDEGGPDIRTAADERAWIETNVMFQRIERKGSIV